MTRPTPELAPAYHCVVCGKPVVKGKCTYLAGATPMGALACEGNCTATASARFRAGQRVDGKGPLHAPKRNDPCPCGSGKKWKKCHMQKDAAPMQCGVPECPMPGRQVQACGLCDKKYVTCGEHVNEISQAMQGHILRVHPEVLEDRVVDMLLDDVEALGKLVQEQQRNPAQWKALFARLDARRRARGLS